MKHFRKPATDAARDIALENALGDLDDELDDMADRYGPAAGSVEAAFFHTTRAYNSLCKDLLATEIDPGRRGDRLVHLAAVCLRLAAAMGAE